MASNREPVYTNHIIVKLHMLLSRKRHERSSPFSSPQRLTLSPVAKKAKSRARTSTEATKLKEVEMSVADETFACPPPLSSVSTSVQLDDFDIKPSEQKATEELSLHVF